MKKPSEVGFSLHLCFDMNCTKLLIVFLSTVFIPITCLSKVEAFELKKNVLYLSEDTASDYEKKQCRLDAYLPLQDEPYPLLVWFHGGGLEGGSKSSNLTRRMAEAFAKKGVGVISADYRLSPNVTFPAYLNDAAAAVGWAVAHAKELGTQSKVFVGGHSAGGYLAAMLAMDPSYLEAAGVSPESIGGFIPVSGQVMTHFTVAKEKGFPENTVIANEAAPVFFARKDTPRILLMIGDDDWPARLQENAYFVALLQEVWENDRISLEVVADRDHSTILRELSKPDDPGATAIVNFIQAKAD